MSRPDTASSTLADLAALVAQQVAPAAVPAERWPALLQLARAHGLAPMLRWVLQQAGAAIPDPAVDRELREVAQQAMLRALLLRAAQRRLQTAFAAAAIPAIWLKGIALAHTVYPSPALRPMGDLDVLVPAAQRRQALVIAEAAGYRQSAGSRYRPASELSHHYVLVGTTEPAAKVEIHWRLLGIGGQGSLLPVARLAWFWSPDQQMQTAGGFTVLKPEAHLLYLCAHAILQHREQQLYLLRFLDMHRLILSYDLNWPRVIAQAAILRWAQAVERALVLAQQFFGTPLPAGLGPALQTAARQAAGPAAAFPTNPARTKWEQFSYRLRSLSLAERSRLMRDVMLPSATYMRLRYHVAAGRAVWPYYPRRWLRQSGEVARGLRHRRDRS